MSNFIVRRLNHTDSAKIAEIHLIAFERFFLSSLGKKFLNLFYRSILNHRDGFGVGLWVEEELVGFAIGTTNPKGFYKQIIVTDGASLFTAAFPSFIIKPQKIFRIISNLLSKVDYTPTVNTHTLLSICINTRKQYKGWGQVILKAFEHESKKMGSSEIILTTEKDKNEIVNSFYKKNDYLLVLSFAIKGQNRNMNLYKKKII